MPIPPIHLEIVMYVLRLTAVAALSVLGIAAETVYADQVLTHVQARAELPETGDNGQLSFGERDYPAVAAGADGTGTRTQVMR
jgi:hypothetical protein